jgi:hypothetical protein
METELQRAFAKEGIQVFKEESPEDYWISKGYRKATDDEIAHFNLIFQYAPEIAKDAYYSAAFQKSMESATKETFRIKLDPNLHLGNSTKTPGAFSANAYNDQGNLTTQAELFKNDATIELSKVPEIASLAFHAIAFATGQYFLAQINSNISALKEDIRDVKSFLEAHRISEIKTAYDDLEEIKDRIIYIQQDPERKALKLNRIQEIQTLCKNNIAFVKTRIDRTKAKASDSDRGETIKSRISEVTDALHEYRFLVWLYNQAKLLEIYFRNNKITEELELDRDDMNNFNNKYFDMVNSTADWIYSYLNENPSLHGIGRIGRMALGGAGAAAVLAWPWGAVFGIKAAKVIIDWSSEDVKEKRQEQVEFASDQMNSVYEYRNMVEAPVRRLSAYVEATRTKFEAVKVGDAIYTNLPRKEHDCW